MRKTQLIFAVSLVAFTSLAWPQAGARQAALEGYDPVLLTEGKEVAGKDSLKASHGQFLYQFSTEETRARFQKEPDRYSIQLDGACARMGAPVGGQPDSYTVVDGKIYIFGSSDCYKAFIAAPGKYLESAQPHAEWKPTAEESRRGGAMLAKVLGASGGEARWRNVNSYVEVRDGGPSRPGVEVTRVVKSPDTFSTNTHTGNNDSGTLVRGREGISMFRGEGRRIPPAFVSATETNFFSHELLTVLVSRSSDQFAGSADPNELLVNHKGSITRLKLDAAGRVVSVTYRARGREKSFGEIVTTLSDYREVDGFMLPFHGESAFDGTAVPELTFNVQKYVLNPADIEVRTQPPAKIREL